MMLVKDDTLAALHSTVDGIGGKDGWERHFIPAGETAVVNYQHKQRCTAANLQTRHCWRVKNVSRWGGGERSERVNPSKLWSVWTQSLHPHHDSDTFLCLQHLRREVRLFLFTQHSPGSEYQMRSKVSAEPEKIPKMTIKAASPGSPQQLTAVRRLLGRSGIQCREVRLCGDCCLSGRIYIGLIAGTMGIAWVTCPWIKFSLPAPDPVSQLTN